MITSHFNFLLNFYAISFSNSLIDNFECSYPWPWNVGLDYGLNSVAFLLSFFAAEHFDSDGRQLQSMSAMLQ